MTESESASTILIADDHPLFRDALRQVVDKAFTNFTIVEASTFDEAMAQSTAADPDLVLLDLNMPGMNGFTGLVQLRNHGPARPIVVVSADEGRESVQQALTYGASGFIPKSLPRDGMVAAVLKVMSGEVYIPDAAAGDLSSGAPTVDPTFSEGYAALTAQQRKVLEMLVLGKSNKVIAYELDIAESTVKAHVSAILRKLKVNSRTQAVLTASKMLGAVRAA